jgi:hypothetical protein
MSLNLSLLNPAERRNLQCVMEKAIKIPRLLGMKDPFFINIANAYFLESALNSALIRQDSVNTVMEYLNVKMLVLIWKESTEKDPLLRTAKKISNVIPTNELWMRPHFEGQYLLTL